MSEHIALADVLARWVPGSYDQPWTWDDEERELHERVCVCCDKPGHYQQQMEEYVAANGVTQGVYLGPDGRVWDGHHRIVAARRCGVERIPLEEGSAA